LANIFSKAWKGIKKTFKKIGRGIKKGFAKFGKFMNKFGIAGQIGMMFIMPGIGSAMMKGFGTVLKGLGAVTGPLSGIASAAQTVLGAAGNFSRLVAKPFTTITEGVTSFLTNTTKYLGNKLGINTAFTASGPTTFLGSDGVLGKVGEGISKNLAGFGDIASDLVSNDISAFMPQPASIAKPFSEKSLIDGEGITTPPSKEDMDFMLRGPDGTLPVDNVPTSGPKPEVTVTDEKGFFGRAADKVREEFSPTSLFERGVEGTAQGVTNVAESAALDAIGLGPEDPVAPDYIRPVGEFRSDQSLTAIGFQPVSYAGYVSGITEGNPNNIGYGGSQSYNAWMQRAVA
jgi:hypothetical protein